MWGMFSFLLTLMRPRMISRGVMQKLGTWSSMLWTLRPKPQDSRPPGLTTLMA